MAQIKVDTTSSVPIEKKYDLYLKISPNSAANLVTKSVDINPKSSKYSSRKSVNPLLVASLNKTKLQTTRKLNTNNPSWKNEILMKLSMEDYCQILTLTIWDKHAKYKNYLGEVRFSLQDLFCPDAKFRNKTDLKWYQMYSNKDYQAFVTGSVLVSFELILKSKRLNRKDKRLHKLEQEVARSTENLQDLTISNQVNINDLLSLFESWTKSLIRPKIDPGPDEQGFYNDIDNISNDLSDMESVTETSSNGPFSSTLLLPSSSSYLGVSDSQYSINSGSSSDISIMSSDGAFLSDSEFGPGAKPPKKSLLQKVGLKRKAMQDKFQLSNRSVLGVIFIEIVSCSDLPPLRNLTRTSYDVDPFVVVTFGKKTFRTSYKRHNLNPVFNERLAFEILSHERNFKLQFSVLDNDKLTFHDLIASISIPMSDITGKATALYPDVSQSSFLRPDDSEMEDGGFSTGDNGYNSTTSHIKILENDHVGESIKKKKFIVKKKSPVNQGDASKFKTMNLVLDLNDKKYVDKYKPELKIRVRFETYENLRRKFWKTLLEQYQLNDKDNYYDYFELITLLDTLGSSNSDDVVANFYEKLGKSSWGGDLLSHNEIIDCLEDLMKKENATDLKIFEFDKCPLCLKKRLTKKDDIDIITHVAICASKDWSIVNKLIVSSFVSPQLATKRWFTKVLIKLAYGKYSLGGNSANILVQDRLTGIIMEEKMGVYVRLGIRLLYKGLDKARTKRIRTLLRTLSIKQGSKFDMPSSKNDINAFIKFHKLDLSECVKSNPKDFETFNDFFYRKLKPNARPLESPSDSRVVTSPADCRCTAFETVTSATELWIKGHSFTVAKLFNGNFENLEDGDFYKADKCSLGIFRLAPQDYHRFHSPVDGVIKSIKFIEGEYYTVNPMAIRSELDVFGENIRCLIAIETEHFGMVVMVAVGAMMVGSTVLSIEVGDKIHRGDEVGYFKFGGSTIILLFEKRVVKFDSDLIHNSKSCVETLIRVGQSIGHSPDIDEFERHHIDFSKQSDDFKLKLIRVLTGGDLGSVQEYSNWESSNIKITNNDIADIHRSQGLTDDDFDVEGDSFDEEGSVNSDY
ncbi:phosphatidylserine decarboxylase-domain-containing protein [Scheffersomyces coipomensis]|uniref:phosphatidylserine decarboxylase-domain-containing protein n=1 Tax=Scheffersomyces coipomensis TaxID=1788519 RepID=UPI00315DBCC1